MPSEIYVSTDCETDGPIPAPHSMVSFASAAFTGDKQIVGTFSANLDLLPGAAGDPKTMAFWQSQPEAWAACRANCRPADVVMPEYVRWLKALPGKPVFVGYPVAFDFLFVYSTGPPVPHGKNYRNVSVPAQAVTLSPPQPCGG